MRGNTTNKLQIQEGRNIGTALVGFLSFLIFVFVIFIGLVYTVYSINCAKIFTTMVIKCLGCE